MNVSFDPSNFTGKEIKVAVVDSGVSAYHPGIGKIQGGVGIVEDQEGRITFNEDFEDALGHGTACAGIIRRKAPDVALYSVKIFHKTLSASTRVLIEGIRWCVENGVKVVNLSLGTLKKNHLPELEEICRLAQERSVILVAAEHNGGLRSYPAAFPDVISVAGGRIYEKYGLRYREGNPRQFVARGDKQRLTWIGPEYVFKGATSFAAPHVTALIALVLEAFPQADVHRVREILIVHASGTVDCGLRIADCGMKPHRKDAKSAKNFQTLGLPFFASSASLQCKNPKSEIELRPPSWIGKAALYPYNSGMKELIRFREMLDFKITGVADPIGGRKVGKDAGEAIGIDPVEVIVSNKLAVALSDADTLVLGNILRWGRPFGRDVLRETLQKALDLGKNVFSLAPISAESTKDLLQKAEKQGLEIHWPSLPRIENGDKVCDVPVVGLFSTISGEGLFWTELILRKKLLEEGCGVGQLSTDPRAELFGFEFSLPLGHLMRLRLGKCQAYLNAAVQSLCASVHPDLVIAGAPPGIASPDPEQPEGLALPTIAFLSGVRPDAYIIVAEATDEVEPLRRCVQLLETIGARKTLALVAGDGRWEEVGEILRRWEDQLGIPSVELSSEEGQRRLIQRIMETFSDE